MGATPSRYRRDTVRTPCLLAWGSRLGAAREFSVLGNVPELGGEPEGCIWKGLSWLALSRVSWIVPRAPFSEAAPPPPPWLTFLCGFPQVGPCWRT